MIRIYKVSRGSAIDFAAEELVKYLRMMMPTSSDISITYDPSEGTLMLGLLRDFDLVANDVEDERYDDILYANCDTSSGVIAGNNERSVLLAVYEYLRKNGCRWLYPGPDGEYIPVKAPVAVSFRIKPSCRHRGYANTTAASQEQCLDFIDFLPKIGMNTFMFEFRVPTFYTNNYYDHKRNTRHRAPEHVSDTTILQWKRAAEAEIDRRGLIYHDVGHGFCIDPFGIDSAISWNQADESVVPEAARKHLAEIKGVRGLFGGVPINTNFCMSDPEARSIVADYVTKYASEHRRVDFLHVWLADGYNNHCECANCAKKSPSDWYMELMNDIDERMTARSLDTKIVFLAYVDTSWAPEAAFIKNPERFVFMLAPFTRSYYDSIPRGELKAKNPPYKRNDITLAKTLEEYLVYYNDWRKTFDGPAFAFEYHFCWSEYYDLSQLKYCKLINDEIRLYKGMGIDGVVEDGDMRPFSPNGVKLYTLARSLFDTSLAVEDIAEDYYSYAYGEEWERFRDFFENLGNVIGWKYLARLDSSIPEVSPYYNPETAAKIDRLPEILAEGRALVKEHYTSEVRVRTISVRILEHFIDLVEGLALIIRCKALGDDEGAMKLYDELEYKTGATETAIERYFNHCFFFNWLHYIVFDSKTNIEFVP